MILANHFKKTSDPRDAYYLGMTLLGESNPKGATQWFLQHIKTSGSDEDKYRSWCRIADAEWMQKDYDQSLYATDEAIKLRPNFPDAYFIKVLNYTSIEEYDKGIEWLKVAAAKPIPDTMAMVDPTLYKYRGMSMGAMCYLFSGRVQEAFRLYQAIIAEAPDFYKEMKEIDGVDWPAMYQEAYYDQQAINHVKYLLYYTGANHGKPLKLFEALPPRLLSDVRLNVERAKFLPKINWPEKSIAIYCGPGVESWGPDTMAKGMGGSEEAIVYLSRELAKLGWQVIVYNDREEEYSADGVTYKPWTLLNPFDRFNVFYAWRSPENTRNIRARRIICDLHDTVQADRIYACDDKVKFFVKSQYHRSLYPELPDDRFIVVGNGIDKSHFKPVKTDRTYDIGYFSSCDRGLECLLSLIPKIEEKLGRPVKSCWAYGWDTFDAMHSKNPDMMKWKWSIIRKMNDVGMENKNRLSHQDLAKLMQDTRVWAYPTEFTEIHCITALKAGEAGCIPVTTDCYALEETVADKTYSVQCQDIYTNQVKQKLFVDTVVKALATKDYRPQQVPNAYWSDVAKVWSEELA
jgi:tetratricopeptide (TPR) repeat protein